MSKNWIKNCKFGPVSHTKVHSYQTEPHQLGLKKLEFQLACWKSSSQILLALGKTLFTIFVVYLADNFTLAHQASENEKLPAQQKNLLLSGMTGQYFF